MQHTPNFNLNLPEGTDLWNYLTQTNPNFATLDTLLKSIQDGTVTTATEVASGTAHAITRTLPDANVIRFTATSAWTIGDTMTIDGTPVTVVKPNGANLQTGDYIIGSEVLGVLRATQFTVYLGAPSSLDAANIDYDNTQSGLTATNVQGAIDEVNSNLTMGYNQYYQDISLPYTALKDELLTLSFSKTGENTVYFKVNTVDVCSIYARVGYNVVTIPLKKGDVLTASEAFANLKASIFVLLNN